jgi:GTPase SAR1 family protein
LLIFPFPVLKPGASEEYLNYIFTNKWKDVEKEINEIKEKLDGFENRLKVLESDYPKIRELLDKMSQINTDINLVKNDIEFLMKEVKELKDKFDLLEKEVGKLKLSQQVQGVFAIADSNKFAEGSLYSYSNVRVKNGRLMIRVENSYYQIVETGGFGNSANKGMNELRKRGIVVLNGPRGIGKSTLAASVIWNLFDKGNIRLVVRVEDLSHRNQLSFFKTFIEKYHEKYEEPSDSLLVLYDPSSTTFYETTKGEVDVSPVNDTVNNIFDIISCDKKVKLLIVLPTDMYSAMSKDVMEKLDEYRLDISLNQVEFLKEVIKVYSCNEDPNNCCNKLSDEDFNWLAEEVAKYEEGYTLIARLVGMELTKSGCNVDNIRRMIEESEHKASTFIAGFINKWFYVIDDKGQVNSKRVNALAEILAIRRYFNWFSPGDPILTKGIIKLIDNVNEPEKEMSDEMINWLVYRQHDLIEDTIERLLNGEDLGEASKPWKRLVIRTNMPKITNKDEAIKYFLKNKKYGEKFF